MYKNLTRFTASDSPAARQSLAHVIIIPPPAPLMRSVWWSYLVIWKSKLRSEANLSRRSTQNPEQHRRIFESSFLASWVIFTPMIWSSCLSWHRTPFVYCSDGDEPIRICILLKYICVISSIFVNKFAQKCQYSTLKDQSSVPLITVTSLVYFGPKLTSWMSGWKYHYLLCLYVQSRFSDIFGLSKNCH